jgi:hypothetical protein
MLKYFVAKCARSARVEQLPFTELYGSRMRLLHRDLPESLLVDCVWAVGNAQAPRQSPPVARVCDR